MTTKCLQCLKPLVLLNNTCITKCPDGYKVDSAGINCLQINSGGGSGGTGGNGGNGGTSGGGSYGGANGDEFLDTNNKTSAYFTTQIAQVVLGGVAVGSKFKDPSSQWHTNTVGLWGPVEMLSFGGQMYLSYDQFTKYQLLNNTASANSSNSTNTTSLKRNLLEL